MSFFSILEPALNILEKLGINPLATDDNYLPKLTGQYKSPDQIESDKATSLAESNLALNQQVASQNFDLAKQQFNYQKELNQKVMDREDNAIQRQVADLRAAGLSPLALSGGASANPLTSANAPQKDMSGINQALGNTISAYNDIFNRKMQRQQFSLQSKVQTAQLYNQLMDSKINREYLNEKLKWEKIHGFRDYSLSSELINLAEKLIGKVNKNSVIPSVGDVVTANSDSLFDLISNTKNTINKTPLIISSKPKEITQEDIDKDLNKIEKAQKSRVDNAIQYIDLSKDYDSKLKTIWEYTNAKDYYNDFDEFKIILGSKKFKLSYLNAMNIHYIPRKRLELGS